MHLVTATSVAIGRIYAVHAIRPNCKNNCYNDFIMTTIVTPHRFLGGVRSVEEHCESAM